MRYARVLGMVLTTVVAAPVGAQYFGQNQVQYDRFKWMVMETPHFLIHYYPEEREGVMDAARMAERSYARLSRMLNHQFREKKPLILYRSRGDFGQNNVTGDLGEGVGGVTEALRHRILLPFTGDYMSFEHVLAHELVHAFQYDIFARGRAGAGLQTLAQVQPPLWFMEGMAEYLSIGPGHVLTQATMRDAALNGRLPTIKEMTDRPDVYFPYRYGEALWEYIGDRWGDDVIGNIMSAVPNVGIERAFTRELGLSLEELGEQWREAMQVKHLPQIAQLERARKFSDPLLNQRKTGGFAELFIAPALSPDGKLISFISLGNFLRGEVFPDLWLGDAETGKRLKRLVKSTVTADFEELRLLYSQSAFSPDGKLLAFTAQREGKDVLHVMDVQRRKVIKSYDHTGLEWVTSPSWSPDGKQIVVSGTSTGLTDLYIIDVATGNLRRLTNDKYGDLQPAWSPDGRTIAFATERGEDTDLDLLRMGSWRIALYDVATGAVTVLTGQDGLNINPQWAPDGKSIAFISDRTGIANVFLYDLESTEHYQLTNVMGAVSGITEYSPAITWASAADKLAFTYFEDGDYTVWITDNPRRLKGQPYRPAPVIVAAGNGNGQAQGTESTPEQRADDLRRALATASQAADSNGTGSERRASLYRSSSGIRPSAEAPVRAERASGQPLSVAQLLDSADLALPDTTEFLHYEYKVGYQPEAIAQPSIGYAQDNYGRGLYGGAGVILSDLLGNNRVMLAGQVNGRLSEAYFLGMYQNLASRLQYTLGVAQTPYFLPVDWYEVPLDPSGSPLWQQNVEVSRYILREAFAIGFRPSNRFTRLELGLSATNFAQSTAFFSRIVDYSVGAATQWRTDSIVDYEALNYIAPFIAYVSDNALFGYTGPIAGRRYRLQIQPVLGGLNWIDYSADYRRYVPLLFNFLTLAWRAQANIAVGSDETRFLKYLGRPDFVRGYDTRSYYSQLCGGVFNNEASCSARELLGSRTALANVELRFPLVRRFDLGVIPISLPPVDGLLFFDAGIAWTSGQDISLSRPANYDQDEQRYVMRSYGAGLRVNLFNLALLRWDYAIPLDRASKRGYWIFSLGPSF